MRTNHTLLLLLCLVIGISAYAQKKPKKELYVPMDYSACGYHASERVIPNVKTAIMLHWQEGDATERIQQAIDAVARRKGDSQGHRHT